MASGLHTNRVFEGCEIIFIPTSKNWKEKVRVYQNGSYGKGHQAGLYHGSSGEKAYLDMIPEPRGNLVYNNFLQSVAVISSSASETNQQKENGALSRQDSDSANQSIQNSGSLLQSGLIEVKVVFIKSHPLKNKEIVLKLYRDKNQTLMGESLTNPRSPPFIVEMNAQQGGPNLRMAESKLAVCRYNKWAKEKQYPFATCVALLTQDDGSMESQILQKEYDLQLPSYTPEQVQGLVVQMKEELTNSQTTMEQELLVRKDYRDRFVFSIESDYYENKEITFSIQTEGSTETELTVYVPDVKRFIPHDSELDKETRRRFKTCNLETRDYPMIPSEVSSLIDLSPEQERLALAITIKIDPNESTPVSIDKPAVVEKCIIKSRHKLSYPDCYRILEMKSREELIEHFPQHKLSKMLQSLLANAEEFKLVKDQLERLLRFGNYTTVALSDPMTIPPLDNFLFGDFLEREGNRRHVKPPQEISNIVTKIEELMNRSVALNLINSMRDFALVRYFRTPTPSRLAKFKTALELAGCQELVDEISEDASSYTNMLERISSPAFSAKRKFLHFAIHAFFQDAYYDIIDKIKLMESRGEAVTGLLPSVTFLNPLHNYLDLHNCRLLALCLDEELSLEELPCLSGTALEAFVVNINKFNTITSEAFRVVKEISWYSSVGLPDLEKVTSFVISRDKNLMHVFLDGEYMIKMIDLDKLQKSAYGDSPHKHARVDKKNKRKGRLQEEDRQKAAPEPQTHETVDLKLGFSADRYSEFTMDLA